MVNFLFFTLYWLNFHLGNQEKAKLWQTKTKLWIKMRKKLISSCFINFLFLSFFLSFILFSLLIVFAFLFFHSSSFPSFLSSFCLLFSSILCLPSTCLHFLLCSFPSTPPVFLSYILIFLVSCLFSIFPLFFSLLSILPSFFPFLLDLFSIYFHFSFLLTSLKNK